MIKKFLLMAFLNLIRRSVLNYGHILVKLSFDKKQLDSFLQSIYPVKTEHPLIRLGTDNDAGYLVPDDLKDISICFSPGVDYSVSFEKQLFDDYSIKSYLCDYSVEGPPVDSEGFEFIKKYLGSHEDEINMTLENWVNSIKGNEQDYLLQMDIEGGEYDVITYTDKDFFKKFRIVIIEFHDLNMLFTTVGFRSIVSVFDKLLENFKIVHVHPNNDREPFRYKDYTIPYVMEFTFLRKDRIKEYENNAEFPHPLDMDNYPDRKALKLPEIFYDKSVIA